MWSYQKKLQYPVNIANPNPKYAQIIISQYGGPEPMPALYPVMKPRRLKGVVDGYCPALPNGNAPDHPAQQPTVRLLKIEQFVGGAQEEKTILPTQMATLQKAL